jgi:hypothetical protein
MDKPLALETEHLFMQGLHKGTLEQTSSINPFHVANFLSMED